MEDEKQELLKELMAIEIIAGENPCGMKPGMIRSLIDVIHNFIGEHCVEGASREQVAKYFGKDVRTITRWKEKYKDFPEPHHHGHKEICYNWFEIVKWKLEHKELWES